MSTATPPTGSRSRRAKSFELQVPRNEQVASLLIAMVIFVTVLVAALFVVWLTYQIFQPVQTVIMSLPAAEGGLEEAFGNNDDLKAPGVEEVAQLAPPSLEQTEQAILDAVGRVSFSIDNPNLQGDTVSGGRGLGGRGKGPKHGDGGTENAIPRSERWKINFLNTTIKNYAKQLDYFKIELAVVRRNDDEISYASGFSSGKGVPRTGSRADERRSRFEWQDGSLRAADRKLLTDAGISIGPRDRWMQFYPIKLVNDMDKMEKVAYEAAGRRLVHVLRTVFRVRVVGGGFEFYVHAQPYRKAPSEE